MLALGGAVVALVVVVAVAFTLLSDGLRLNLFLMLPKNPLLRSILLSCDCDLTQNCVEEVVRVMDMFALVMTVRAL